MVQSTPTKDELSMRFPSVFGSLGCLLLLSAALSGCGGESTPSSAGPAAAPVTQSASPATASNSPKTATATGKVTVDGSSTVFRISKAAQGKYMKSVNPNVNVTVGNHGTGGGFQRYLASEIDIIDASRPAKPDEESLAKAKKLEWTRYVVGYDGITVVVNPENTFVESLTVEQLKKLFAPDSNVKTWKDLDATWPDREIVLYTPDTDSGTFEFFTEAIVGKQRAQRKDVQASPDDNVLVTGVAGDRDGLGYFGYAYYVANKNTLRAVPIKKDAAAKAILPNPDTILSKEYSPLSRPLFIYVKNQSMKQPAVSEFVTYYLENIESLAKSARYVPPTADDQSANKKALDGSKE
jgi:phosphate transport system substrate-binding protein